MTDGPVLILTGPPGVGKTTTARALAARFDRAVDVESDLFFSFIRSGFVEPWKAESAEQNDVVKPRGGGNTDLPPAGGGQPRAVLAPAAMRHTWRVRAVPHSRAAWILAALLAVGGIVAYAVVGGTLWWWLGLGAVVPLVGLMFARLAEQNEAWPPASGSDGPWGAP